MITLRDTSGQILYSSKYILSFQGAVAEAARSGIPLPRLDARGQVFRGANLANLYAPGADFSGARIHRVQFDGAVLPAATFDEVDMQSTSFLSAFLSYSRLKSSNLDRVVFCDSSLFRAKFSDVRFHHADFHMAGVDETEFDRCFLHFRRGLPAHADYSIRTCWFVRMPLSHVPVRVRRLEGPPPVSVPQYHFASNRYTDEQLLAACASVIS